MNGEGTFTFPDGRKYVGGFKDDLNHGYGVQTYADGNETIDKGIWKDGKLIK